MQNNIKRVFTTAILTVILTTGAISGAVIKPVEAASGDLVVEFLDTKVQPNSEIRFKVLDSNGAPYQNKLKVTGKRCPLDMNMSNCVSADNLNWKRKADLSTGIRTIGKGQIDTEGIYMLQIVGTEDNKVSNWTGFVLDDLIENSQPNSLVLSPRLSTRLKQSNIKSNQGYDTLVMAGTMIYSGPLKVSLEYCKFQTDGTISTSCTNYKLDKWQVNNQDIVASKINGYASVPANQNIWEGVYVMRFKPSDRPNYDYSTPVLLTVYK